MTTGALKASEQHHAQAAIDDAEAAARRAANLLLAHKMFCLLTGRREHTFNDTMMSRWPGEEAVYTNYWSSSTFRSTMTAITYIYKEGMTKPTLQMVSAGPATPAHVPRFPTPAFVHSTSAPAGHRAPSARAEIGTLHFSTYFIGLSRRHFVCYDLTPRATAAV